jgi:arylsulfatase A-like enzyme
MPAMIADSLENFTCKARVNERNRELKTVSPFGNLVMPQETIGKKGTTMPTGYEAREETLINCVKVKTEFPLNYTRLHGRQNDPSSSSNRKGKNPWLLNVNIYDPHPPFTPPKSYADQFDPNDMPGPHFKDSDLDAQAKLAHCDFQDEVRTPEEHDAKGAQARYYAMIAQIDDQFGRILKALEESGQRENTVIIFTSDHGESLGDHGLMYKGCRFYEGLVRVPLIFSWPGKFIQEQPK